MSMNHYVTCNENEFPFNSGFATHSSITDISLEVSGLYTLMPSVTSISGLSPAKNSFNLQQLQFLQCISSAANIPGSYSSLPVPEPVTMEHGLQLKGCAELNLVNYSDADWATYPYD